MTQEWTKQHFSAGLETNFLSSGPQQAVCRHLIGFELQSENLLSHVALSLMQVWAVTVQMGWTLDAQSDSHSWTLSCRTLYHHQTLCTTKNKTLADIAL